MWDTVLDSHRPASRLTHDLPCLTCGHAAHTFLACDSACDCRPAAMPGSVHA